jgi:hypothetical protein
VRRAFAVPRAEAPKEPDRRSASDLASFFSTLRRPEIGGNKNHLEFSMKSSEMNRPAYAVFLRAAAVGLAFIATAASAGTNGLTVNVVPVVPNIGTAADPLFTTSYSGVKAALGQKLNSAYQVSIKNETTSNVNNAWFKIKSSYNGGAGLPFLDASIPSQCTKDPANPAGSALTCQFDGAQLLAGVSFVLVIENPDAPNSGSDSTLKLLWTVQAGQGNADANPSNVVQQATPVIVLSVNTEAGLRSYVLQGQGFKVANGGSQTKVTPPAGVPVDLKQEFTASSCSPMYKKCLQSTLSIVDVFTGNPVQFPGSPLVIDLLRDKSTLKGFADINNAVLHYTGEDGSYDIQKCDPGLVAGTWVFPGTQSRCVVPVSTDPAQGTYVDPSGHWHFRVLGKTNGIINW